MDKAKIEHQPYYFEERKNPYDESTTYWYYNSKYFEEDS